VLRAKYDADELMEDEAPPAADEQPTGPPPPPPFEYHKFLPEPQTR